MTKTFAGQQGTSNLASWLINERGWKRVTNNDDSGIVVEATPLAGMTPAEISMCVRATQVGGGASGEQPRISIYKPEGDVELHVSLDDCDGQYPTPYQALASLVAFELRARSDGLDGRPPEEELDAMLCTAAQEDEERAQWAIERLERARQRIALLMFSLSDAEGTLMPAVDEATEEYRQQLGAQYDGLTVLIDELASVS